MAIWRKILLTNQAHTDHPNYCKTLPLDQQSCFLMMSRIPVSPKQKRKPNNPTEARITALLRSKNFAVWLNVICPCPSSEYRGPNFTSFRRCRDHLAVCWHEHSLWLHRTSWAVCCLGGTPPQAAPSAPQQQTAEKLQ